MPHKWELYKDKAGEYRVRFKYNSEVMFATEGYSSKQAALAAIQSAKKNMPGAEVFDNTGFETKPVKKPKKTRLQRAMEEHKTEITSAMNEAIAASLVVTAHWADPMTQEGIIIDVWVGNKCVKSVRMIDLDKKSPHGLFQLPDNA